MEREGERERENVHAGRREETPNFFLYTHALTPTHTHSDREKERERERDVNTHTHTGHDCDDDAKRHAKVCD